MYIAFATKLLCVEYCSVSATRVIPVSTMTTPSAISVPKQFSEGSPAERFEICCTANGWGDETKPKRLPMLIEGEALAVWLELSKAKQNDYKVAKAKMLERMGPVQLTIFIAVGRSSQPPMFLVQSTQAHATELPEQI